MLIEFSRLKKLPIFEIENQTQVATLADFFIDPEKLQAEAAIARSGGIFAKTKFIPAKEIIELSKAALVVGNEESLVEPHEIVRLEKKFKNRPKIIGEKVVTKSGEILGQVFDYVLEDHSLSIVRIYLKKFFDQRIIHSSAIVKIDRQKIIVKDNFEMIKPEPIPAGAKAEPA